MPISISALRRSAALLALATLAACGADGTGPTDDTQPLAPGTWQGTVTGTYAGTLSGTARSILPQPGSGNQSTVWFELRDERVPSQSTLVRLENVGLTAPLAPGTYSVVQTRYTSDFWGEFYSYALPNYEVSRHVTQLSGTMTLDSVSTARIVGRLSLSRSGIDASTGQPVNVQITGRFNAIPAPTTN